MYNADPDSAAVAGSSVIGPVSARFNVPCPLVAGAVDGAGEGGGIEAGGVVEETVGEGVNWVAGNVRAGVDEGEVGTGKAGLAEGWAAGEGVEDAGL